MTAPEAIRLLQEDLDCPSSVPTEDLHQAQTLAIEALKRILLNRNPSLLIGIGLLPGETQERTIQRQGKDSFGDYSYEERTK